MRGLMTDKIQEIAKKHIGRELISTDELRLIPYIQTVMCNKQEINPRLINSEDRAILQLWEEKGFIKQEKVGISVTKEFWDFMCEILFESYVKDAFTSESEMPK